MEFPIFRGSGTGHLCLEKTKTGPQRNLATLFCQRLVLWLPRVVSPGACQEGTWRVGGSAGIYLLKGEEAGSDSGSAVGEHSSEKCTLERLGQTSFYLRARTGRWQKHFLSAPELKQGC